MTPRDRAIASLRRRRGLSASVATALADGIAELGRLGVKASLTTDGGQIGFVAEIRGQVRRIAAPPGRVSEVASALATAIADARGP